MNLSKNSFIARYYKFTHGSLPNDLCSLFWGVLFSIPLLPLVLIGRILAPSANLAGRAFVAAFSLVCLVCFWAVGLKLIIDIRPELKECSWWILLPLGFLGFAVILAMGAAIVWVIIKIYKSGEKGGSIAIHVVSDFKNKTCTKIDWK